MASSAAKAALIQAPVRLLERRIYVLRGQKVMLDRDLAELYQVETRVLNQAVRRNIDHFPKDFMFQLNKKESENSILPSSTFEEYISDSIQL